MENDFLEDDVDEHLFTCHHELLFDFLYAIRQHHRQPEIEKMFSPEIDLSEFLKIAMPYIGADYQTFRQQTEAGCVEQNGIVYVHTADVLEGLSAEEKKLLKRSMLDRIPEDKKSVSYECTVHSKSCSIS